jgi:hypothetical protein
MKGVSKTSSILARLLRIGSQRKRFYDSARAAGLTAAEARSALEAEIALFSHELADAWQVSESLIRQIEETVAAAIRSEVFETKFDLQNEQQAVEFQKLRNDEVLDWLKANGHLTEVFEITFKSVIRGVAIDLLEFAAEALRCTIQGPLTVAIALLRKPFKENLFVLEWILADPGDYFERFFSGDASNLRIDAVKPERKREIIRAAMEKTPYGEWMPAEFLYELRYEKQTEYGFELLWQHANHLITTQGNLKTEGENLNFVFSTADDRETQWRAFYTMAPLLFFHAHEVVETAICQFAIPVEPSRSLMRLRTAAGLSLWMRSPGCIWNLPVAKGFASAVRGFLRSITCTCGKRVSWRETNVRSFFEESKARCFSCGETIDIVTEQQPHEAR